MRAAIATVVAGSLASLLGVGNVYWAAAVALLLLHQDLDWLRTIAKGLQRVVGTLAGVLLAGGSSRFNRRDCGLPWSSAC